MDNHFELDPWIHIYTPALAGDQATALTAMTRLESDAGRGRLGAIMAVSARALRLLGLEARAQQALERALSIGGREAAALASIARPEGARWAAARVESGPRFDRADAACDLAWWALRGDRHDEARLHIAAALATCPGHAEALRWGQLLDRRGRTINTSSPQEDRSLAELELFPRAELGWLSEERAGRRLATGTWIRRPPPGSGQEALLDAGTLTRIFATDTDYAMLPASHPLVSCERCVDLTLAAEREGGGARDLARQLLLQAAQVDREAHLDAAQALVALGVRDPSTARTGLRAAEVLHQEDPASALWRAYRCRLRAEAGDRGRATREAEALLKRPDLGELEWLLALEALRRCERHETAHGFAQTRARHPRHSSAARRAIAEWSAPVPIQPLVSDRLSPRFAQGDRGGYRLSPPSTSMHLPVK